MTHNQEKIDETVLATLLLTLHDDNRAWENHSFEVLDRWYEKGFIYDSKGKVKFVFLSDEGFEEG